MRGWVVRAGARIQSQLPVDGAWQRVRQFRRMAKQKAKRQAGRKAKKSPTYFAKHLLAEWKRLELPLEGGNVLVAVSGGADSTALLLALDELFKAGKLPLKIVVAHLDHGLRSSGKEDAKWVSALAEKLGHEAVSGRVALRERRKLLNDNLEQAARRARYDFLQKTAGEHDSHIIMTAHTLDDQAETVLMRLLRGSAAEGLSGMESVRPLKVGSPVLLVRPLLSWARRADTESYCRARRIKSRCDEMNEDERFTRVRIRKQLLPLMSSFNSRIVETLARTASLLREDAALLSEQADQLLRRAIKSQPERRTDSPVLNVKILSEAPPAVRRRALRLWIALSSGDLRRLEMVHLLGVERLLKGTRGGRVAELPNGAKVIRAHGSLELRVKNG